MSEKEKEVVDTTDTTKTEESVEEEVDVVPADDTPEEEESEEEDKTQKDTDNEIDYDAEIEAEKKRGQPDPIKAADSYKKRQERRKEFTDDVDEEDESDEDDKPMTRREARELIERTEKIALENQAMNLARTLAKSDKEAELIALKWKNMSFSQGIPLKDQLEDAFVLVHKKRILGEREEAVRALKSSRTVTTGSATAHRTPAESKEPKTSPQDAQAFKAAGMTWNGVSRRYEKKLGNGDIIYRDPKTKETRRIPKNRS